MAEITLSDISTLVQAVTLAQKRGAFSIQDSASINPSYINLVKFLEFVSKKEEDKKAEDKKAEDQDEMGGDTALLTEEKNQ